MAGNDYRGDQGVLHCVVPLDVKLGLRARARAAGLSLTAYVVELCVRDLELSGPDWVGIVERGRAAKQQSPVSVVEVVEDDPWLEIP